MNKFLNSIFIKARIIEATKENTNVLEAKLLQGLEVQILLQTGKHSVSPPASRPLASTDDGTATQHGLLLNLIQMFAR